MWKSRKPIETADNTYQYFDDDKIQTKTDARGASASYGYNNRGLLASVSYAAGSSGATATNSVTFEYNELGQRTKMDDGPGVVDYVYNSLGRMTSETRTFDMAGAPTTPFVITYGDYNLAGQVKNIKDPFDDEVNYSYDKTGRLATMTGATSFAGLAGYPYLSSASYRAFNAIKDGRTYDTRMRVSSYSGFGGISYQYNNASQLTTATMSGSEPYTQSFSYDPAS